MYTNNANYIFTYYLTMQSLCYPTIYGYTSTDHKLIALIHSAYTYSRV